MSEVLFIISIPAELRALFSSNARQIRRAQMVPAETSALRITSKNAWQTIFIGTIPAETREVILGHAVQLVPQTINRSVLETIFIGMIPAETREVILGHAVQLVPQTINRSVLETICIGMIPAETRETLYSTVQTDAIIMPVRLRALEH